MIKLIVFDLDGTLVDSSQDITNALNHPLSGTGIPPVTAADTVSLIGEGITRLIEKVVPGGPPLLRNDILNDFLDFYGAHLVDHTRPYPSVLKTLEALREFPKAVVSNKREYFSREILRKLNLLGHFVAVLGSDSVGHRKPSPGQIDSLLTRFSVPAADAIT